ncbi:MAG: WXG100 family type VII secretion target [Clostridium sp.]|nr:WXG100 family type VII secretion target [Clostridium sp.]MCM1207710.1 WXG100 family type VII secretion target [Ruminococcus sp.]
MADKLELLVDPSEIERQARVIEGIISSMQDTKQTMKDCIISLEEVWRTKAQENYLDKYNNVDKNIINSLSRLTEHVEKLKEIAQGYTTYLDNTNSQVNSLSTDNIF